MEYNRDFADSIGKIEFNKKAKEIYKIIEINKEENNHTKDPNAYEMTNIFLFAGKYNSEGEKIDMRIVKKIWDFRKGDFEGCGIESNSFVYQICEQSYKAAISNMALVNDESSHSALRKMAGIGLYLMQQKREQEQEIDYNNLGELINLIKNTKILKEKHPYLHDNLKFANNLNVLYRIQKIHLDEKNAVKLDEIYNDYINTRIENKRENEIGER